MGSRRVRLWDDGRRASYVRERDDALERRAGERLGTKAAGEIDAIWAALAEDERAALEYLLLAGASSCIGRCSEPVLARLVERGLLIRPPGVRPVLTDDLATSFLVPRAVWAALEARRDLLLPSPARRARRIEAAEHRFRDRITPVAVPEAADPRPPGAPQDGRGR